MPSWVHQGFTEYQKRLPKHWQFTVREIPQANLGSAALNKAREGGALLSALPDKTHIIALDNRGASWSTVELANQLQSWQELGKPVGLIIGGPDGLDDATMSCSHQQWSLSALTFPHPLVRIVVAEQLYRAHSLLINHPYHRA